MTFTGQKLRAIAAAGGRPFRRFLRGASGTMSVEAVLWLPMFLIMVIVIADTSLVFSRRAQALRIVQDANRGMSMYRLTSEAETMDYILSRIHQISPSAQALTTMDPTTHVIRSSLVIPLQELDALGFFSLFPKQAFVIVAYHMREV